MKPVDRFYDDYETRMTGHEEQPNAYNVFCAGYNSCFKHLMGKLVNSLEFLENLEIVSSVASVKTELSADHYAKKEALRLMIATVERSNKCEVSEGAEFL
jgi:hypothetical protein